MTWQLKGTGGFWLINQKCDDMAVMRWDAEKYTTHYNHCFPRNIAIANFLIL